MASLRLRKETEHPNKVLVTFQIEMSVFHPDLVIMTTLF